MAHPEVSERFAALDRKLPVDVYNYAHFRTKHFAADVLRTITGRGIQPGELAPDFALPRADGGTLRLSDWHGRPVLLHFGSLT